jgi:uncharacterized protein YcgI (DUF1989 family)
VAFVDVEVMVTARQLELLRSAGSRVVPEEALEVFVARSVAMTVPATDERAGGATTRPVTTGPDGRAVVVFQGQAACVELRRGERMRVEQTEGGQCADVLAWGAHERTERLSAAVTRTRESASPGLGARLWSGWPHERPLLSLSVDSAPGHDLLHPACTPGEYADVGALGEPACALVQAEAAVACGLERVDLHDPLNLWFRPTLDVSGAVGWRPTPTRPGDQVELEALEDVLVVVNPCVDDVFGCAARPGGSIAITCWSDSSQVALVGRPVDVHELTIVLEGAAAEALAGLPEQHRAGIVRREAVRRALCGVGATSEAQ